MKKRVIYITSLFLLLIYPLSAAGISASVYKCKHNGALEVSLFSSAKERHAKSCKCANPTPEKHVEVVEAPQKKIDCCSAKKIESKKVEVKKSHSCCSKSKEESSAQSPNETAPQPLVKMNSDVPSGSALNKIPCCSSSNLRVALSAPSFRAISADDNITIQFIALQPLGNLNVPTSLFTKTAVREVLYPKKEPISALISFIHFSSLSLDGDHIA